MAISKIILNGVVQMDVTGKTVTAGDMLNGVTALKSDGTDITGNISNMTLPSASSSTASGTSKATITPGASAQYLNIPVGYLSTAQYYTIAAASGGASNIVTGTFKGTTTGAAMDVTLNYSGNGYPLYGIITVSDGAKGGAYTSLIQRYAMSTYMFSKQEFSVAPTYSANKSPNASVVAEIYKTSSTSATSYGGGYQASSYSFRDDNASATGSDCVKIRSSTKMSVFIAGTSYGFAPNIEYSYCIIYSS